VVIHLDFLEEPMKKILCIGQVAYDITLLVEEYPQENKKMRAVGKVECAGGSAFNSAYLLTSWKMDTTFVGTIGNDYYASQIEQEAKEIGMKTHFHKIEDFTTTSYIITNTTLGTRTIITNKNKNANCTSFFGAEEYDLLVLDSNELNLSLEMLKRYPNAISILDAGKYSNEVLELGSLVDYFVCSKDFAEKFCDFKLETLEDYRKAYDKIYEKFQNQVVITLESKGSFTKEEEYELIPSISVKAVDSTGAGDIYHGAFAYFIANGRTLKETMKYANIAGALSVQRIGSKESIPSLQEVLEEGMEDDIL